MPEDQANPFAGQPAQSQGETQGVTAPEPTYPSEVKFTRQGQEVALPWETAMERIQQGEDYTQKTQRLADEKRQFESLRNDYFQRTQAMTARERELQEATQGLQERDRYIQNYVKEFDGWYRTQPWAQPGGFPQYGPPQQQVQPQFDQYGNPYQGPTQPQGQPQQYYPNQTPAPQYQPPRGYRASSQQEPPPEYQALQGQVQSLQSQIALQRLTNEVETLKKEYPDLAKGPWDGYFLQTARQMMDVDPNVPLREIASRVAEEVQATRDAYIQDYNSQRQQAANTGQPLPGGQRPMPAPPRPMTDDEFEGDGLANALNAIEAPPGWGPTEPE